MTSDDIERSRSIYDALHGACKKAREVTDDGSNKRLAMLEEAIRREGDRLDETQIKHARHSLRAFNKKYLYLALYLEQLWSLSTISRCKTVSEVMSFSIFPDANTDPMSRDIELDVLCSIFEGFLLIARSAVDVLFRHLCDFLNPGLRGKLSVKTFRLQMRKTSHPKMKDRAQYAHDYIDALITKNPSVLEDPPWLLLLIGLRDKVAHMDAMNPSQDSTEFTWGKLHDWPTVRRQTLERFIQEIQNGMFEITTELLPVVYNMEWISGHFREGMFWDAKSTHVPNLASNED